MSSPAANQAFGSNGGSGLSQEVANFVVGLPSATCLPL